MDLISSNMELVNSFYQSINSSASALEASFLPVDIISTVPVAIDFIETFNENQSVLQEFKLAMDSEATNIQTIGALFDHQDYILSQFNSVQEAGGN